MEFSYMRSGREVTVDALFKNNSYFFLSISLPFMPWEKGFWSEKARVEEQKRLGEEFKKRTGRK